MKEYANCRKCGLSAALEDGDFQSWLKVHAAECKGIEGQVVKVEGQFKPAKPPKPSARQISKVAKPVATKEPVLSNDTITKLQQLLNTQERQRNQESAKVLGNIALQVLKWAAKD